MRYAPHIRSLEGPCEAGPGVTPSFVSFLQEEACLQGDPRVSRAPARAGGARGALPDTRAGCRRPGWRGLVGGERRASQAPPAGLGEFPLCQKAHVASQTGGDRVLVQPRHRGRLRRHGVPRVPVTLAHPAQLLGSRIHVSRTRKEGIPCGPRAPRPAVRLHCSRALLPFSWAVGFSYASRNHILTEHRPGVLWDSCASQTSLSLRTPSCVFDKEKGLDSVRRRRRIKPWRRHACVNALTGPQGRPPSAVPCRRDHKQTCPQGAARISARWF